MLSRAASKPRATRGKPREAKDESGTEIELMRSKDDEVVSISNEDEEPIDEEEEKDSEKNNNESSCYKCYKGLLKLIFQ